MNDGGALPPEEWVAVDHTVLFSVALSSILWTPSDEIRGWIHGAADAPVLMGVGGPVGRFQSGSGPGPWAGIAAWLRVGTLAPVGWVGRRWITTFYTDAHEFDGTLRVLGAYSNIDQFLALWSPTLVANPASRLLTDHERSALVLAGACR